MTKVRSLLFQAKLLNYLQGEALLAAVFLYNRTPHSALKGKTPYEMKNGSKPRDDISTLRVFGSTTFYKIKGLNSHLKLKVRARKAILIGYTENTEVYKLQDIELRKVVYSRDIEILEGVFHSFSNSSTEIEILESKETESLRESSKAKSKSKSNFKKSGSKESDSEETKAS